MKKRTAKLVKKGKIEIFEETIPAIHKGEVLVQIKSVGICGSDVHYFLEGGLGSFKQKLPMEMGHEASGIVVESKSKGFKTGDRVAIEPGKPCLICYWCLKGRHNLCENGTFMGANAPGAFSDYVVVSELQLLKIPKEMSFNLAALMEPVGVGLHAINLTKPTPNSSIAIVGSGSIGLTMMSTLRELGFKRIFMIDKLSYRVAKAKVMGAKHAFELEDCVAKIKQLTEGRGVSFVYDTGGTEESVNTCIDLVGVSGTVGLIGIPTEDYIRFNPHKMRTKEIRLQNVRRSNQTLEESVRIYSDSKKVESVITHEFELNEIQKAFEIVSGYKKNVVKCMIVNNKKF